ncbi:uncharacterized protein LOC142326559 [Lycorma delicatula]|uniref:uncharacterized protein LOC142326559 n=1 Tax=Lycorma delicatula TaxID=130591 RepID=UPI003F50E952
MATNKFILLISIILAAETVECTSTSMVEDDDVDATACHCGMVQTEKDEKFTPINYDEKTSCPKFTPINYDEKTTCQSCNNLDEAVNTDIPKFLCARMKGYKNLKVTVFSDKCRDIPSSTIVKFVRRHISPVRYCSTVLICCEGEVPTECSTEKIFSQQEVHPITEQSI